jgi:hypothetical protein
LHPSRTSFTWVDKIRSTSDFTESGDRIIIGGAASGRDRQTVTTANDFTPVQTGVMQYLKTVKTMYY